MLAEQHMSGSSMSGHTGSLNQVLKPFMFLSARVPSNCPRDFNLLAFDPDGDEVKCRYGKKTLSECNPCTPPSVLNLSSVSSRQVDFHPEQDFWLLSF